MITFGTLIIALLTASAKRK
ncbi:MULTISPECIES: putative holin-like toxin [Brevibacillus]|nr:MULTISPECIES: putative holin-like toxin [Brevibacillus]MCG7319170.1 putative holin-like toxin [Brevibacillus laterosporus]